MHVYGSGMGGSVGFTQLPMQGHGVVMQTGHSTEQTKPSPHSVFEAHPIVPGAPQLHSH